MNFRRSGSVRWDEANIFEHDQLRGTRMKIDEPKTPYPRGHEEGMDNELDIEDLQMKMSVIEKIQQRGDRVVLSSEIDEDEVLKKKKEFEQKRKSHYNEFRRAKGLESSSDTESSS